MILLEDKDFKIEYMKDKIYIYNLYKSFNQQDIFTNIDLSFDLTLFNCIKGSSGSGKSTLLNLISTLDKNYNGDIYFNETHYKSLNDQEQDAFRSSKIGFIFQEHHMINDISILENILLPNLIKKDPKALDRALTIIEDLGLKEIKDKKPYKCSGGEKQRASLARAIINEPRVIIADEPTGSLDEDNSIKVARMFKELNRKYGIGVILATHDDKVANFADVKYFIDRRDKVRKVSNNSAAFHQSIFKES